MACRHIWPYGVYSQSGPDPCQSGQSRHPVRTAGLALIQQVVVQFAIAIDLAAILPGLALIFSAPFAEGLFEPGIKPAGVDVEYPAHGPNAELHTMRLDKRVPHFASLAKYAVAFLGCPVPR